MSEYMIWRALVQSIPDSMKISNYVRDTLDIVLFSCSSCYKNITINNAIEKELESAKKVFNLKACKIKTLNQKSDLNPFMIILKGLTGKKSICFQGIKQLTILKNYNTKLY